MLSIKYVQLRVMYIHLKKTNNMIFYIEVTICTRARKPTSFVGRPRKKTGFEVFINLRLLENYRVILFSNSPKTNWATIRNHCSKEAEIHRILFDTCDDKIWPLLFLQSLLEQIWSVSLKYKLLKKSQHRPRLTVWAVITADGLIGPVILRDECREITWGFGRHSRS